MHYLAVDCGAPVRPDNGRIIGTDFTFQHTVQVQCGPGFFLDGPAQLTCNENAAWVGGEYSPMCIGKTTVILYRISYKKFIFDQLFHFLTLTPSTHFRVEDLNL